jgi:cell wall-associated NlpC family hydrolase
MLDGNVFSINQKRFQLLNSNPFQAECSPQVIIKNAELLLNTPYLWGGRSVLGMDCSGFTQLVFKACGLRLYRDAYQQATQGSIIDFVEEAQAGDLAFFDNQEGSIVHTGIIMTNRQIIHASGSVRIDHLDHQGIFNSELNRYTHQLRLIKRIQP